jgi:hypothetical protein
MGKDPGTSPTYAVPRLLAFYKDLWDEDGTAVGWEPIAWGLRFADGSALSISISGPPSVTLWQSVEDATEALDAYVDTAEPRINLDRPLPPPPPPPQIDAQREIGAPTAGDDVSDVRMPFDTTSLDALADADTNT